MENNNLKLINFKERKNVTVDMTVERLRKLCRKLGFNLFNYDEAGEKLLSIVDESGIMRKSKGFAWGCNKMSVALYDPMLKGVEKLYVILHEIGHLALGHVSSEERLNNPNIETEANIFASVFLAMMIFSESGVTND